MEHAGRIAVVRAPLLDVDLATPRLRLRGLRTSDAAALAAGLADFEVSRWLARVPYPYDADDALAFVDHVRHAAVAASAVTFGIVPAADPDGQVVGVVALHGLDGTPEFGYWLARRWWGTGLMTEATTAALDWIHDRLRPERITSGAFTGNHASLAIQRRHGFAVVGTSRRPCSARGGLVDHVDTLQTPESWAASRAR